MSAKISGGLANKGSPGHQWPLKQLCGVSESAAAAAALS